MRLEWSLWARADRQLENPRAAAVVDRRISERVNVLQRFPMSGRLGRVDGTRELVIARTPYIVAYRIIGDAVLILRVLHSSQQWPNYLPD